MISSLAFTTGPQPGAAPGDRAEALERRAEEAYRSAEWVRSILDCTIDAICVTDEEQIVTDCNTRFLELWQLDPELVARRDCRGIRETVARRLVRPAEFFNRLDHIKESLDAETRDVIEMVGGRKIDRRSRLLVVQGRGVGRVWSFRDITERLREEDALRAREQRLSAILSKAAVGIAVAGLDGRFQDANRRFEEIVGQGVAELRQKTFLDITHKDDRAATRERSRRLLAGEVVEGALEKRYVRPDGTAVWCRTTVSLMRGLDGEPLNFMGVIEDITHRKEVEEALQRNEAELRALADSMPHLAWMAEPDGHIFWYNRRWFEYTGTTLEEMRGWGWQSVPDPVLLPKVMERWRASIRAGATFDMEFPLRGSDGVFRWFLTRAIPVRDASGKVARWFGTNTEIDRAKRAEDALREETRVLELLNRTGTAIASQLALPELLRTVTDAGTEISGAKFGAFFYAEREERTEAGAFTLSACSGTPPEDIGHACEGREKFLSRVFRGRDAVLKDDAPEDVVAAGFPPSRSYIAVPVVSRSGEVLGGLFFGHPAPAYFDARTERVLLGVAAQAAIAIDNARLYESAQREIEERALTERLLRESETRLRVSLQTTELGTWEIDVKSGLVTLDDRARELLKPTGAGAITMREFMANVHPEDRATRSEALRRVCAGEVERHEMEFRAGGRWLRSGAKPVREADGVVRRVVGGVLDITALMRARETIEERQRELERLVEERTASLHQAIEQMEEFSYSVSHDLRAPLRAIQGYSQAVLEDYGDRLDPKGREQLSRILHASERMDRLTRDVLIYSRVARGAAPLASLSLDCVVADVIDQYAPVRRGRGFICVENPLLPVCGHEPLLVQAVSNLLANSLKFVAEDVTPHVRVWTERRGDEVRLWVEDNGIGVKPEHRARIWGMFDRIHPTSKYEGTGIGLAIVRKAVERMGGSVGVESDGRSGSRFWIQLKAA